MKGGKLKKKTAHSPIIFPSTYLNPSKETKDHKKIQKIEERKFYRTLSKCKSESKDNKINSKSFSLHSKFCQVKNKIKESTKQKATTNERPRKLSVQRRFKRGCSAIQLSKIYYDNLQKKLQLECQSIMKQQNPKRYLKTFEVQKLSGNLLRIRQEPQHHRFASNIVPSKSQVELSTVKIMEIEDQKADEENKFDQFLKDLDEYKEMTKKIVSNVDISISGNDIQSQKQFFDEYRHHNSLMNDLTNTQQSILKSQINQSLIEMLEKTSIYFFSSKFTIKYPYFFKINRLRIIVKEQQKTFDMEIFFVMYGEIIFKRISFKSTQQKRADYRNRKGHMKRIHLIRQKIKEKVLSNFTRECNIDVVKQFYLDLILYLEHFIIFQKTYRGLVFIDHEENSLELKNYERIYEMLKINKSFYFILKLNFTFYIVKVIISPHMEIKFTFIYDFTTHNTGDQLNFTHDAPKKLIENKNETQTYKIFLRVIDQFTDNISSSWKSQETTNKQILEKENTAKISQIIAVSLEKWDDPSVDAMRNINKSYHFMDGIHNYFQFHDHFDYGYFESPHHVHANGKYHYSLDQMQNYLPVYYYPHNYVYLQLNQVQKQMITIPHIEQTKQEKYQKHTDKYINDFLHRQTTRKYKKDHQFFTLYIGKRQIRMKQKLNLVNLYIHYPNNLRCQKLSIPIEQFPSYNAHQQQQLDMKKASSYVERFLKGFKLQRSFLYSKLVREQQSGKMVIYHKGIQKLQRQFVFITLYGLTLHQIIEFKIFMFRYGREFIIRFDSIEWLKEINLKELIASLLQLIKSIYFKKLIQQQARKSKKRRLDTLQNFLKKHGKSYVNQARSKKKLDEQFKRKMMRLANFKQNSLSTLVYQNIITDCFNSPNQLQFLITIRFVPSQEFREQNEWKSESIEICVHKEGCINYFKLTTGMKELIYSVSQGKLSIEYIDFRQVHNFFKEIRNKIKEIINTSYQNFSFIISRLKHFLIYNYQPSAPEIYPFKFRLLENIIYETKDTISATDQIQSQVSIEYQMERQAMMASHSNLIFSPCLVSEQKQQQLSSNFSFVCKKPVNHPYRRYVDQNHIIEIMDIFRNSQDYKVLKQQNPYNRQIWITDRETGYRSILSEWETGFLSSINFGKYNHKLFRRLLKSLKPAL